MAVATVVPMAPISKEAESLLDTLSEHGVEVTNIETYEDNLGVSVHWDFHGLRHSSGGPTVEEALAYVVLHVGHVG